MMKPRWAAAVWVCALGSGSLGALDTRPHHVPPDPRKMGWVQTYTAGHRCGQDLCGGSEIMHIKAHGGSLFAFNGYWMDSHYPAQQSAQVLRLDEPDGVWVVDLNTAAPEFGGRTHMKGNILSSVFFSTDKNGNAINQTVLVAASKADSSADGGTAISVFTRDDSAKAWRLQTLLPGPQGGRKVPRDILIHRDAVTHIDRIFLLCGDSGVISGVWDSDTSAIEWEASPEYPGRNKTFPVRALGLASANGMLYFSVGSQLYVRHDGAVPRWTVAYQQDAGKVNTEMGGIRGLTALRRDGEEDSLIFLWTPTGNTPGPVVRLDGTALRNSTETTLRDLYNRHADSGGGTAKTSLGGYNQIFQLPLQDLEGPSNRETSSLHIVGFEQSLLNATQSVEWNGFYSGGCYAIRKAQEGTVTYSTWEVNGRFGMGKPVLEAPRAFEMSPFPNERGVLYVGGFDANFHNATNMAWIFKAGLDTILGEVH